MKNPKLKDILNHYETVLDDRLSFLDEYKKSNELEECELEDIDEQVGHFTKLRQELLDYRKLIKN